MSGYIFWCSRCKDRHAGECDSVVTIPGPTLYPSIGTHWRMEVWPSAKASPKAQRWHASRWTGEVLSFDAAVSKNVVLRIHPDTWPPPTRTVDVKAFHGDGIVDAAGYKHRMVIA